MRFFDPRQVLQNVITLMRVSLKNKSLDIHVDIADNVPHAVKGQTRYFERIINNLLGNAIKFTPNGHINIALTAHPLVSNEVRLQLIVEDHGYRHSKR